MLETAQHSYITLLICTYNRAQQLGKLIESALTQDAGESSYEILIVDNNSSDETNLVVDRFRKKSKNVRYLFEKKQGKSFALQLALRHIKTEFYAIIDDDFILPINYVSQLLKGFRDNPNAAYISGKVLPEWQTTAPDWLTNEHWSPLAIADFGDKEFVVDLSNRICLLACAFKTETVKSIGGYDTKLGVNENQIGGTEDEEIAIRLWQNDQFGVYLPNIWFNHIVSSDRCSKNYHRRWHIGHGMQRAVMKDAEFERSSYFFLGVPGHLYRETLGHLFSWIGHILTGRTDKAFSHEIHLRFFQGFFKQRLQTVRDK